MSKKMSVIVIYFLSVLGFAQSPTDALTLKNMNHKLLNSLVREEINILRAQKKVPPMDTNTVLQSLCKQYQSNFENRRFNKPSLIEKKILRSVYSDSKKRGFTGGIITPIAGEYYALDYDGKSEFFYDKEDEQTALKLFYGPKKKSERTSKNTKAIPYHTYQSFAKALVANLVSNNKKELYKESYRWSEVHLQWHYKSLHKNHQIPVIKAVILLAGYQTALMRD